jgi:hypothetical protein
MPKAIRRNSRKSVIIKYDASADVYDGLYFEAFLPNVSGDEQSDLTRNPLP